MFRTTGKSGKVVQIAYTGALAIAKLLAEPAWVVGLVLARSATTDMACAQDGIIISTISAFVAIRDHLGPRAALFTCMLRVSREWSRIIQLGVPDDVASETATFGAHLAFATRPWPFRALRLIQQKIIILRRVELDNAGSPVHEKRLVMLVEVYFR